MRDDWLAGLASFLFTSSRKALKAIDVYIHWPSEFMDWIPGFFQLVIAAIGRASAPAGYWPARSAPSIWPLICIRIGVWLSFPIILLSQLDINSHAGNSFVSNPGEHRQLPVFMDDFLY